MTPDLHHATHASRAIAFEGWAAVGDEPPLLEGRLYVPADGTLHPGVVLCHGNPAAQGHMDMKVMLALEEALAEAGFATLRYNSRGVQGSGGSVSQGYDKKLVAPEGMPETEDVGAALEFLGAQDGVNNRKLALVGHSFGARVGLAYLAAHPKEEHIGAVVCIGLAVGWRDLSHLGQWPHPKLFVAGERDDFCPPEELRRYVRTLPEPSNTIIVKETGHFFEGKEGDLGNVVASFLKQVLG
jgi:alpha/beta superfamily hydrolase